jgi:HK97 gp10 family phage protein
MTDKIAVQLIGKRTKDISKEVAKIKKFQVVKGEAVRIILKEQGFEVEKTAKRFVTKKKIFKSGRLRASISTNWSGSNIAEGRVGGKAEAGDGVGRPDGKPGLVVVVGTNVFYGPFHEFGTRKMEARPYLFPAYFAHEKETILRVGRVMKSKVL